MVKIGQNNFKFTPAVNDDIAINVGEAQIPVSKRNELSAPPESPKSGPPAEQQMIFGEIPEIPTQEAVDGIKFDFNDGDVKRP